MMSVKNVEGRGEKLGNNNPSPPPRTDRDIMCVISVCTPCIISTHISLWVYTPYMLIFVILTTLLMVIFFLMIYLYFLYVMQGAVRESVIEFIFVFIFLDSREYNPLMWQ